MFFYDKKKVYMLKQLNHPFITLIPRNIGSLSLSLSLSLSQKDEYTVLSQFAL